MPVTTPGVRSELARSVREYELKLPWHGKSDLRPGGDNGRRTHRCKVHPVIYGKWYRRTLVLVLSVGEQVDEVVRVHQVIAERRPCVAGICMRVYLDVGRKIPSLEPTDIENGSNALKHRPRGGMCIAASSRGRNGPQGWIGHALC
jgi:hypothetical protein